MGREKTVYDLKETTFVKHSGAQIQPNASKLQNFTAQMENDMKHTVKETQDFLTQSILKFCNGQSITWPSEMQLSVHFTEAELKQMPDSTARDRTQHLLLYVSWQVLKLTIYLMILLVIITIDI